MSIFEGSITLKHLSRDYDFFFKYCLIYRVKKVCFKTLVDEVQELEALSKDPGAVVHGKRYSYTSRLLSCYSLEFTVYIYGLNVLSPSGPKTMSLIKK